MFETINKHFVEFSNHQSFSERTLTTEVMALVTELNDIRLQIKQGKLATVAMEVRSDRVIVLLLFHVYARGRAGTPLVAAIMRIIDGTVQAEEQSKLGKQLSVTRATLYV